MGATRPWIGAITLVSLGCVDLTPPSDIVDQPDASEAPDTSGARPRALIVIGDIAAPNSNDVAIRTRLEDHGIAVTAASDESVTPADTTDKVLVVISISVNGPVLSSKLRDVTVPMVVLQPSAYDGLQMTGPLNGSDYGQVLSQSSITITGSAHPLAGGLPNGDVVVYTSTGHRVGWGVPGPEAVIAATPVGNSFRAAIFVYPRGAMMVGRSAPAKRVGFFVDNATSGGLGVQGRNLLQAAIDWTLAP